MSLFMHLKRTHHSLPSDNPFKLRKNNQMKHTYVLVPILVESNGQQINNSLNVFSSGNGKLVRNKPILPKINLESDSSQDLTILQLNELQSKKNMKSSAKKSNVTEKKNYLLSNRRSTECQTVRKKNRVWLKNDVKSTQTQTLHSSFNVNSSKTNQANHEMVNKKCSSFTQTFIDDIEQNDFIVKDAFLSSQMTHLAQSAQTEFSSNMDQFSVDNYNTTETQTNASMTDFDSADIGIVDQDHHHTEFKFPDLEFIDIETQTIWNYDRTTQTENDQALDNWLMNL